MNRIDKKILKFQDKRVCYDNFQNGEDFYHILGVLNLRRNFIEGIRLLVIREWWSPWNAKKGQTVYRKYRLRLKNEKTRSKRKIKKV